MKWKPGIEIKEQNGLWLYEKGIRKIHIDDDYAHIVHVMTQGVDEDDELIERVSEQMDSNAILAGLMLAQFVETYGVFLMEGSHSRVFE